LFWPLAICQSARQVIVPIVSEIEFWFILQSLVSFDIVSLLPNTNTHSKDLFNSTRNSDSELVKLRTRSRDTTVLILLETSWDVIPL
jgi:hypothetical protein